jgi:DNA-binding response OmpR family regulator
LSKNIVVIEDDADICELLTIFLSLEGYKVIGLSSALAALKLLNNQPVSLITLDLSLPDLDGNEFLAQLAKAGSTIPVLVVSANPEKLKPSPLVKRVLRKPFDLEQLLRTVRHLVEIEPYLYQIEQMHYQDSLE